MGDYTLLVAALLPKEVYGDETWISEAFNVFDIAKKGVISADDILTIMRGAVKPKDANRQQFSDMLAQFDANNDGYLDMEEFSVMLKGPEPLEAPYSPARELRRGASPSPLTL